MFNAVKDLKAEFLLLSGFEGEDTRGQRKGRATLCHCH